MKTYNIIYTLLAAGEAEVEAKNKTEAENIFYGTDINDLINNADFDNSLDIFYFEEKIKVEIAKNN